MNILLDTCILLWIADTEQRFTTRLNPVLSNPEHTLFLSTASIWEIVLKVEKKKLFLPDAPKDFIQTICRLNDIETFMLVPEVLYTVPSLPTIHKDPFDRLLVAEARHHGMTLLTADRILTQYDTNVMLL